MISYLKLQISVVLNFQTFYDLSDLEVLSPYFKLLSKKFSSKKFCNYRQT